MSRQVRLPHNQIPAAAPPTVPVGEDLAVEDGVFGADWESFVLENPELRAEFHALAYASAARRRARAQK